MGDAPCRGTCFTPTVNIINSRAKADLVVMRLKGKSKYTHKDTSTYSSCHDEKLGLFYGT